ncbi:MAG TPA: HAD-IA family hydrolase [Nocardioidaceae bacterium]|nr:HAD-IA family hydrolase [Nocardioidaceae bacterium]
MATTVEGPDWGSVDAVLFDLDGVITPTAEVHMHAWAEMFSAFLEQRHVAPYTEHDYFAYVDGKPRYDGVAALLASRGLDLPWGDPGDTPDTESVCGLGNRKNAVFGAVLARDGVQAYPGSLQLLDALDARGTRMAIVSSSANAPDVLRAAGLLDRFETVVDGGVARAQGLPGKPRPDTYQYAADTLGVDHPRAVVVEDAVSGVEAGAAGDFALVVGVDRGAGADTLREHGADVVVADLAELVPGARAGRP